MSTHAAPTTGARTVLLDTVRILPVGLVLWRTAPRNVERSQP
jgi:hypothetical protein